MGTETWSLNITTQDSPSSSKLIKEGAECLSSDESLGTGMTLEECSEACSKINGCKFFILGSGSKEGYCYWEKTENENCDEGWEDDEFNFYAIVPDSGSSSKLIKEGAECLSSDESLGTGMTLEECSEACSKTNGCKFFILGSGS